MFTLSRLKNSKLFMVFLGCMAAMGPISIDAYLPMMPSIAAYFETSVTAANLTMSAFLVGSAIGQFFGGSLSDQLGRKTIGLTGLALFFVSSVFIIYADTIVEVQMLRVTQAIGSGFASVVCLAQVRDLHPKQEVMRRYANVVMVVLLAPLLGPLLGASLIQFGWQAIFVLLAGFSLFIAFVYLFLFPETLPEKPTRFSTRELFAGYYRVVTHRVDGHLTASRFILFMGFNAGVFLTFVINSALIYMTHFGLPEYPFAIGFGVHAACLMLGNRIAVRLAQRYPQLAILRAVNLAQLLAMFGLCAIVASGFGSILMIAPLTLLVMGIYGAIMPTASSLFIGLFDKNVGAAASLSTTTVFFSGGVIGALAAYLAHDNILPIFIVMTVSSALARTVLLTINVPEVETAN